MGLLTWLGARRKALSASPEVIEAISDRGETFSQLIAVGPRPFGRSERVSAAIVEVQQGAYGWLYRVQPAVRTVVDLIARNAAQATLRCFERVSETEREPDPDHPAAEAMRHPNDDTTGRQFIQDYVTQFLIYHNAYAIKFATNPRTLHPLPAHMVGILGPSYYEIDGYRINRRDGTFFDRPREDVMHWRGSNPLDPRAGISPLETLRKILIEDAASQEANVELMEAGLALPGYLFRPVESPKLDETDATRIAEDWRAAMASHGRRTPMLEEGTEFKDFGVTPRDAEMLAGRQFTLASVANLYGVPLSMFSERSREEDQKRFYADVLAPLLKLLAEELDLSLLIEEYDDKDRYFEFDLNEKLIGEELLKSLTTATGVPILLRNEARARLDLPPVEDGDEPITPLNVLVGGKPSPNTMPIQDPLGPSQDGDAREDEPLGARQLPAAKAHELEVTTLPKPEADMARQNRYIGELKGVLDRFYKRQRSAIVSKAGATEYKFDSDRWNRELADDLERALKRLVHAEGAIYVGRLGGDDFDPALVRNYIGATAAKIAENLNAATAADIVELGASSAFDRALGLRSDVASTQIGARMTGHARISAAKQSPGMSRRGKTWVSNTDRHGGLNGATVPLESDWNGLIPGQAANCGCTFTVQ